MNENNYVVIMAGGIGSRFWPSSTAQKPKQFLDILGVGKSLIRLTFERINKIIPEDRILVITNEDYRKLVSENIPEIPDKNILGEPSMNNTAPTVAWAALHLNAVNPNSTFAVLPSDHVILKEDQYIEQLVKAFDFASSQEAIVTLGIQPTRPDTGYGYIEYNQSPVRDGVYKVKQFREKPDLATAQQYLDSGRFLWNAGMFVWSTQTILSSFQLHSPAILNTLMENQSAFGTEGEKEYIKRVYPNTDSVSIDYAILEKADNVYTLPSDIGWSDLGTWNSLYEYLPKSDNQCVVLGENTFLYDTANTIVRSDSNKIVVIKGLQDYIVVDESDALLIYPKKDEQEIKAVVKEVLT